MPYNNPYIEKIRNHPHILTDEAKIFAMRGGWRGYCKKDRLMLEIGTGMGNFFSKYASEHPDTGCIGIELKYKRLHRTYEKSEQKGRGDVVVMRIMGQEITEIFAPGEIDELYLLFSDPWPKKKHFHNRVIQDDFLRDAASILSENGIFLIKTDEASYAEWIEEHLIRSPYFTFEKISDDEPDKRPSPDNSTEFETMGRREGSKIVSFLCRKK